MRAPVPPSADVRATRPADGTRIRFRPKCESRRGGCGVAGRGTTRVSESPRTGRPSAFRLCLQATAEPAGRSRRLRVPARLETKAFESAWSTVKPTRFLEHFVTGAIREAMK